MSGSVTGRRRFYCVALVALVALALLSCGGGRQERPDVVLIVIDTLRPDFLGFYGHEGETAEFLAGLAERSAVMRRAFSTSSWTAPSTASLFTSWLPSRHGVVEGFVAHQASAQRQAEEGREVLSLNRLPTGHQTLAEFFSDGGYRTFGLASNINIGEEIGFARGFDRFALDQWADAEALGHRLDSWLAEDDGAQPRLIYLHLNDVHIPYTVREPWYEHEENGTPDDAALYRGEIGYVDNALRGMFERHGWADSDTIVAVVSDHGQEFHDHGRHGHGFRLYRELVQVLAMVHAPARGVVPRQVQGNVSLLDILPTLADLAGLEALPEWKGVSLVPVLEGGEDPTVHGRAFLSHRVLTKGKERREMWSVVQGDWHLIEQESRLELFDLAADPGELDNLVRVRRDVVAELSARIAEDRARTREGYASTIEVEIDEERLRALEALGYVQ